MLQTIYVTSPHIKTVTSFFSAKGKAFASIDYINGSLYDKGLRHCSVFLFIPSYIRRLELKFGPWISVSS